MRKHQFFGAVLLTCFRDFDPFLLYLLIVAIPRTSHSLFSGLFLGSQQWNPEKCAAHGKTWQHLGFILHWELQTVLTLSALSFTCFLSKDLN